MQFVFSENEIYRCSYRITKTWKIAPFGKVAENHSFRDFRDFMNCPYIGYHRNTAGCCMIPQDTVKEEIKKFIRSKFHISVMTRKILGLAGMKNTTH